MEQHSDTSGTTAGARHAAPAIGPGAPALHAVRALARSVIRRSAPRPPLPPEPAVPEAGDQSLAAFCATLVQPTPGAALRFIAACRDRGLSREGVYLGYVCDAARWLGEAWDDDRLSFLEVTIACGHLHALLRMLGGERAAHPLPLDTRRRALFATVPGEAHGIGVAVAATLFRDVGWDIDLQLGRDHDSLLHRVATTRPPVVGLSLSTPDRLDALAGLVAGIRRIAPDVVIGVAPGQGLPRKRLARRVDIDLVFDDARLACIALDRLIRLRAEAGRPVQT
ncbi:MAG: B12-binding domain-containing protein [Gemmobacter sp.]